MENVLAWRPRPLGKLPAVGCWGQPCWEFGNDCTKGAHSAKITRGDVSRVSGLFRTGRQESDSANVQTRAEDMGDHWLVNGQKNLELPYADQGRLDLCTVRTASGRGQGTKGISFSSDDMDTPGITTRPNPLISGQSPFCETFFDNVKSPQAQPCRRIESRLGISTNIKTC